jgi:glucosylceramidase
MQSRVLYALAGLALASFPLPGQTKGEVSVWLTNPDKSALFAQQGAALPFLKSTPSGSVIDVDDKQKFQSVDGFGFALTGGSAQHLVRMDSASRAAILHELFATDGNHIGISYLRVSIGASDLNDHVFSYDDLPEGETDVEMKHFDLGPDRTDVIPVLKEILAINPKIKILGSPWSAPLWMKTSGKAKSGKLKPECYAAYATYFVKYIQAMKAAGIHIDAVTLQNEPLTENNTPSMRMIATEQADFLKNHIGPAFRAAHLDTKVILYDHNCDVPDYAIAILNDPEAAKYADGSGFHLYGGKIDAMSQVHAAHPNKNLYFTEQMIVGPVESKSTINLMAPVRRLIIGASRNWSRNVLLWNLAADPKNLPHTDNGGCSMCQGAITIDGNNVSRNLAYYTVAHASKFVRPGSVRIASNDLETLPNVAFQAADGRKVLIVTNGGQTSQTFGIRYRGKAATATLMPGAVATYVW